jgi:hypothetical protein
MSIFSKKRFWIEKNAEKTGNELQIDILRENR